ncbi:PilZ domain-containing protein [Desulfobotulus alkaliphilus]|uniref:PilZ domain-containing protein n=1 Tax=Desulfobotulus alkaliphilus TaxID=622671 RepID=A0A562RKG2_9BACT|nr:PilZ domain-containing protein [Desulfobotulus alkaliphilus]TWI68906.1 PilZ domain-containing protein [Desulfobotulus alkaliphilus]
MTDKPEKTLLPGTGIEVVFNLNSLSPMIRSAMLLDVSFSKQELIISQTIPTISRTTSFKEMHVTTLMREKSGGKKRYGFKCRIKDFQKNYLLSDGSEPEVLLLHHEKDIQEINIRSGYRISPGKNFPVFAKLVYNGKEYICGKDFSIRDLSVTGVGLVAPKNKNSDNTALLNLKNGTPIALGMVLSYPKGDRIAREKVVCAGKVARANPHYNKNAGVLGLHFIKMVSEGEESLMRFIHEAQLEEIRQLSRY